MDPISVPWQVTLVPTSDLSLLGPCWDVQIDELALNGQQVEAGMYPTMQQNLTYVWDVSRQVLKPLVIVVHINGHLAWALVDLGSLGDFVSSTLTQQLGLKKKELKDPIPVQLAVQGSRSHINYGAVAEFQYQNICKSWYFDVINLSGYDLILGTPWLFQYKVAYGLTPPCVIIGSSTTMSLTGEGVTCLTSRVVQIYKESLD